MINSLNKIFNDLKLAWIDTSKEILNSGKFSDLIAIFPNLKGIFQKGRENDEEEFLRTIRHIFRVFKIFFSIKNGSYYSETLSPESIQTIKAIIIKQCEKNELIIPLILIYHDIGRFFDKKNHPHQSYLLISEKKLLEPFELSDIEKMLVRKVIQYHLLFAAIYTGEATYYGVYSLLNDEEFIKFISNKQFRDRFVDLLEIFTYIDVLGYSYAKIYNHYIKYYNDINNKLKNLLDLWPHRDKALEKALEYSQDWLEWRIAGALRIFQFVETKPHLTREFYFNKLEESIKEHDKISINDKVLKDLDWETVKNKHLIHVSKVQIKYGLGILMILAFGDFFRSHMKKNANISSKLVLFWILLSNEISSRFQGNNNYLWNVFFTGLPHWSKWDRNVVKKLDQSMIELILKKSTHNFDEKRKEYNLYLDFALIF